MSWLESIHSIYENKRKQCHDLPAVDGMLAADFVAKLPPQICSEYGSRFFDVIAVLSAALRSGHTCLDLTQVEHSRWFNATSNDGLSLPSIDELQTTLDHCLTHVAKGCFQRVGQYLYMQRYWHFETEIVGFFQSRLHAAAQRNTITPEQQRHCMALWTTLFPDSQFSVSYDISQLEGQELAVYRSLTHTTLLINGGPGTGKTYTAARILSVLGNVLGATEPLSVRLIAPTGKAAQRLSESLHNAATRLPMTGMNITQATTVHRFLGLRKGTVDSNHNRNTQCDVLLVDEASMIDTALFARLCRAVDSHTRLILLGDANQLPSVEAGNCLDNIIQGIRASVFSSSLVTLLQSKRFQGDLAHLANACLHGEQHRALELLDKSQDIEWLADNPQFSSLQQLALQDFSSIKHAASLASAFAALKQRRWLTPFRTGDWGVEGLNSLIEQSVFGYNRNPVNTGGPVQRPFFKGQVIMVIENHSASGLFNGDVGLVWPDVNGNLTAYFELANNEYKTLSLSRLPQVESAFAMTIHKSQGSEFDYPRLILADKNLTSEQAWRIVHRSILYTAVTRAKSRLGVIGHKQALIEGLNKQEKRMSGLVSLLAQQLK